VVNRGPGMGIGLTTVTRICGVLARATAGLFSQHRGVHAAIPQRE